MTTILVKMTNSKMKLQFLKIIFITSTIWIIPWPVLGASLNFNPASMNTPQAQPYTVTLILDTEDASLNAIEGMLRLAPELGDDITITDSGSVVTYWVQQPTWDQSSRTIKFSATVPGGYTGQKGILFSLVLPAYFGNTLNNAVMVVDSKAYVNDGLGTELTVTKSQFGLSVNGQVDSEITQQLYLDGRTMDNIPPETFSPQVSRDERVFDNQWFLVFATIDKQSGIARYEIQESRSGRIDSGQWKVATSPYLLEDQELNSFIYITAIDRQGNERVIKVFPKNTLSWWDRYWNDLAIAGSIIIVVALAWLINRRRIKLAIRYPAETKK